MQNGGHRRKLFAALGVVAIPAMLVLSGPSVLADTQFQQTDNPIEVGPPVTVPSVTPTTVAVLTNQQFNNAHPPVKTTVAIPSGRWGKVILTITGSQQGRQYDRLMEVWAGNTQLFVGCTPEPTTQGIQWKVQKDVTQYLPALESGNVDFTTELDNYVNSTYTGIPNMSVTLSFYPDQKGWNNAPSAQGSQGAGAGRGLGQQGVFPQGIATNEPSSGSSSPWDIPIPTSIVPLSSSASMATINSGTNKTLSQTVTLPNDITGAYLDLYVVNQNVDEFYYANEPAFREVEISIDGKPAGVVWPYPYIFTGGINPMFWRPITGIHTLDMPSYRVDLTPFAGMLSGKHTVSFTVVGNQNYWLANGSLFLYEDGGQPTSGSVTTDTLTFPTDAPSSTTPGLSSDTSYSNQTANKTYQISGTVNTKQGTFNASVNSTMSYANDQTLQGTSWELVHGLQTVTTDESITDAKGQTTTRHSQDSYTVDMTSGYLQSSTDSNAYSIPGTVTQSLNEIHSIQGSAVRDPYHSALTESVEAYAVLQRQTGQPDVAQGATTAYANFSDSRGNMFNQTLMARGGQLLVNQVTN